MIVESQRVVWDRIHHLKERKKKKKILLKNEKKIYIKKVLKKVKKNLKKVKKNILKNLPATSLRFYRPLFRRRSVFVIFEEFLEAMIDDASGCSFYIIFDGTKMKSLNTQAPH